MSKKFILDSVDLLIIFRNRIFQSMAGHLFKRILRLLIVVIGELKVHFFLEAKTLLGSNGKLTDSHLS